MKINANYLNLKNNYLFSTIARKVTEFKRANPGLTVYRLDIGDVTLPLAGAITHAMAAATAEMGEKATFRGYGPEQGHVFLRTAVQNYYKKFGVELQTTEIFISDGAKSDLGNFLDILSCENSALIPDPVYPAYVDVNVMLGRKVYIAPSGKENGFKAAPPKDISADIIYLCSPNNPTGAVFTKAELEAWVDYAKKCGALILFDGAYESFIRDPDLPRSIYQINGAEKCAVEICSFSKTAGFTGTRCGYTIVPHSLVFEGAELNKLWLRRQCTKFNGVPYVVQRAAEAVFSEEGQKQIRANIDYYMENAACIHNALDELKIWHVGGVNSPYIWLEIPNGLTSWEFFDILLTKANVVGTPGAGFGEAGEGFFRLNAFGDKELTGAAMKRFAETVKSL
jgi:LL-diaminopimelate aminotransferase